MAQINIEGVTLSINDCTRDGNHQNLLDNVAEAFGLSADTVTSRVDCGFCNQEIEIRRNPKNSEVEARLLPIAVAV